MWHYFHNNQTHFSTQICINVRCLDVSQLFSENNFHNFSLISLISIITLFFPHRFHYKLKAVLYMGSWRINVSCGVMEKWKEKKPLTLKINFSHAICNSKDEDTFSSCYLYVKGAVCRIELGIAVQITSPSSSDLRHTQVARLRTTTGTSAHDDEWNEIHCFPPTGNPGCRNTIG